MPSEVRRRGAAYFRDGAVEILTNNGEIRAHVRGSRRYTTVLEPKGDQLTVFCDCPYFGDGGRVCKHIWATLLAAETDDDDFDHHDDFGDELDDDDIGDLAARMFHQHPVSRRSDRVRRPGQGGTSWRSVLRTIDEAERRDALIRGGERRWPDGREQLYVIDIADTMASGSLTLDVLHRDRKRDGTWTKGKPASISDELIRRSPDAADRQVLAMLLGTHGGGYGSYRYGSNNGYGRSISGAHIDIPRSIVDVALPLVCATGRARLRRDRSSEEFVELRMDDGPPWEFALDVTQEHDGSYSVTAALHRFDEKMGVAEPLMTLSSGFLFTADGTVARLAFEGSFGWISLIRRQGTIRVPADQIDAFLERAFAFPSMPPIDLPPAIAVEEVTVVPRPRLRIGKAAASWRRTERLSGSLSFDYDGSILEATDERRGVFDAQRRRLVRRDRAAEAEASDQMKAAGFTSESELLPKRLPQAVRELIGVGWHVEAEGKLYRTPGAWRFEVSSGIDWFDLEGGLDFDGTLASLPDLLAAAARGESYVTLSDGSVGLVPEEWLARYSALAGTGTVEGERLRFRRGQVGLLDALLAEQPDVTLDDAFRRARDELASFERIEAVTEPAGFVGELRPYQREGLGWLGFLERFGFGGCLADDMGLGKTIQVLALLEGRRKLRTRRKDATGPSLVVVPKSLVFNWLHEAARFTPKLKVLDHTGARLAPGEHFTSYDVVLTTYGTLRRDAAELRNVRFDYAVLDEAQAIKNASTATAKAARLIQADHRLALSGTPIENHLGELWSLFEFLNPGVLGSAPRFVKALNGASDPSSREGLSHALRPFILRRTKEQVAADLPRKSEQTLHCELVGAQRKRYDQLRQHYQRELLARVDRDGINRSKVFVLEALLRLRQAACHPGLIDKSKRGEPSAKLDVLLPQLVEVAGEGHKALVFSQFTQMLAIVRDRLDREGIVYEYLDGRTRDRAAKVERFQSDPDVRLFLISLKAGGLGLNLTAADYVFLLDPWWNPAVEAQAIDRTHRIGQTRPVFAYRIIARDTVEEKVLELQGAKRALADAIINADNSLIRRIDRDDLELLLS